MRTYEGEQFGMSKFASQEAPRRAGWVRLSVVLSDELAEHVRVQAFLSRQSRSAYVRNLIENDASRAAHTHFSTDAETKEESSACGTGC